MIEDLALEPIGQEFDLTAIYAHLESLPTAMKDPANARQYLLASDPDVLRDGAAQRTQHPERIPYSLTVVAPTSSRILIAFRSADTDPARAFVKWLHRYQGIRILDQDFNDFTKEANNNLDFIFGATKSSAPLPNPRATIVEWEQGLSAAGPDPFVRMQTELTSVIESQRFTELPDLVAGLARMILVDPERARVSLDRLARSIEEAFEVFRASTLSPNARLGIVDLFNVLQCCGAAPQVNILDVRSLLADLVTADLPFVSQVRIGFIALVFKELQLAEQLAGRLSRGAPSGDLESWRDSRGLLGHFIAAHRGNGDRFMVLPAWRTAVESVTELRADGQLDETTLFWIARLVYHIYSKHSLDQVAIAAHEILWRVPDELDREATEHRSVISPAAEEVFPLHYTLDDGAYLVDEHLLGSGSQQLFSGHHVSSGAPVILTCDIRGSRRSIEELRNTVCYQAPGVFKLGFVGGFDVQGRVHDHLCDTRWAIVERVPDGVWLPRIFQKAHEPQLAAQLAVGLGLSSGRILARAEKAGICLARVRPEYMWVDRVSERWEVVGLSARGDELLLRKSSEMVTAPIFDRYYHAPEWHQDPDDRTLVFTLAVMIAEWAMGRYPFAHLFHGKGLDQANHLPIEAPGPLRDVLEDAIRFDRNERPHLDHFLARLADLSSLP
jgi:hypothetical protein